MKKDKLLRRLSAMQFAMWEMREFLDTHPNCPDAKALYNAYKEKIRYPGQGVRGPLWPPDLKRRQQRRLAPRPLALGCRL